MYSYKYLITLALVPTKFPCKSATYAMKTLVSRVVHSWLRLDRWALHASLEIGKLHPAFTTITAHFNLGLE